MHSCYHCKSVWDDRILRHEIIQATDLPFPVKNSFKGAADDLTLQTRDAFRKLGWEFGGCVYIVLRCPSCQSPAYALLKPLPKIRL